MSAVKLHARAQYIRTHVATFDPAHVYYSSSVSHHVLDAVDILCQASGKVEGSQEKAIGAYKRLGNIPWRLGEPAVSEALGSRGSAADRAFCDYNIQVHIM